MFRLFRCEQQSCCATPRPLASMRYSLESIAHTLTYSLKGNIVEAERPRHSDRGTYQEQHSCARAWEDVFQRKPQPGRFVLGNDHDKAVKRLRHGQTRIQRPFIGRSLQRQRSCRLMRRNPVVVLSFACFKLEFYLHRQRL